MSAKVCPLSRACCGSLFTCTEEIKTVSKMEKKEGWNSGKMFELKVQ